MSPALSLRWFMGSRGGSIWPPDGSRSSKQKQKPPKALTLQESQNHVPAEQLHALRLQVAGDKWIQGWEGKELGECYQSCFPLSLGVAQGPLDAVGGGGCLGRLQEAGGKRRHVESSLMEPGAPYGRDAPSFCIWNASSTRTDLLLQLVLPTLCPHDQEQRALHAFARKDDKGPNSVHTTSTADSQVTETQATGKSSILCRLL